MCTFPKDWQALRELLIEAAPFSWMSMGALLLAGSSVFLQGFHVHRSHNIDNVQKPFRLTVCQEKLNREKRGRMDGWVSGCARSLGAKWEGRAVVFSLHMLQTHTTMAKQPAQPCLTLASSFLAWKHRDPWSCRGCKPQQLQIGLEFSHSPTTSPCGSQMKLVRTMPSSIPTEMPGSNLLSWKYISVFS